jgi:hypothetical protein
MDKKHTPEPWLTRFNHCIIYCKTGKRVANTVVQDQGIEICTANAARIVACVNACEGMDDPAALREVVGELVNAMEKQHVVCKERLVGWDFSDLIAKAKELLNG